MKHKFRKGKPNERERERRNCIKHEKIDLNINYFELRIGSMQSSINSRNISFFLVRYVCAHQKGVDSDHNEDKTT